MEWNKSFLSFATSREAREGRGSPNGGIHYSRGEVAWEPFEALASFLFPSWKYKALDLTELGRKIKDGESVEVGPAVEYFDGGIVINERFETTLEGLYAAGECALGPFGSNRVASAITEMLVHGADAGTNAAEYASQADVPPPDTQIFPDRQAAVEQPLTRTKGQRPAPVRRRVQEMAHKHLGPIRNGAELKDFIDFLEGIKESEIPSLAVSSKSRVYNKEWIDALELEHMVHLLETAARSALFRAESRGVHYREDYPDTSNDSWLCESVAGITESGITIKKRPVTTTTIDPPKGTMPYLDMMKKMMEAHSDVGGHH
jgi:succinate dehydrogenase/fumarate reductase flavoprotein subunit